MKFEEILPELRKGRIIHRKNNKWDVYYFENENLIHNFALHIDVDSDEKYYERKMTICEIVKDMDSTKGMWALSSDDILAEDWEIYSEVE